MPERRYGVKRGWGEGVPAIDRSPPDRSRGASTERGGSARLGQPSRLDGRRPQHGEVDAEPVRVPGSRLAGRRPDQAEWLKTERRNRTSASSGRHTDRPVWDDAAFRPGADPTRQRRPRDARRTGSPSADGNRRRSAAGHGDWDFTWADAAGLVTLVGLIFLVRYQPAPPQKAAAAEPAAGTPISGVLSGPTVAQPGLGAGQAVLGKVVTTEWGQIQVQLTVDRGRVTSARAVRIPEIGGKTGEGINTRAIPVLDTRTVTAQSAKIDAVSGATVSSDGYRTSLQSAIDAAHL